MSSLLRILIFLPLLFVPTFCSKRPFADTDGDPKINTVSKTFFSGMFHSSGSTTVSGSSTDEDGNNHSWFQKHTFGMFGGDDDDPAKKDFETNFMGSWKIDNPNVGVEAMQLQLMPNNKVVWFDTTALGDSALRMFPAGQCPKSLENPAVEDCFAHAVEYDLATTQVRPLKLQSDPWCSSGGLAPNGDLIISGGYNKGIRAIRTLKMAPNSEFKESLNVTAADRWYPSNLILDDSSYIIMGGRNSYDYEIIPPDMLQFDKRLYGLQFLSETCDRGPTRVFENNLYPFLFLLPDGNVFIFANNRSIIIEPKTGRFVRELPALPGGSRNYPATGSAVMLPLDLNADEACPEVQVLVCGGNTHEAFDQVDLVPEPKRFFAPALEDCGRIVVTKDDSKWEIEQMPSPRVMGDMFILPNGQVLIVNGAKRGTAAWEDADDANMVPALYDPKKPSGKRFKELAPTNIPRMYHSAGCVLPDTKVLIAGSNPHSRYIFNAKYNTELRVERFSPPYLDPALSKNVPVILKEGSDKKIKYGEDFYINIELDVPQIDASIIKVKMYPPPFTSHQCSMNQRQLILKIKEVANNSMIKVVAPINGKLAPPGYYLIYVVHRGVPSTGWWVQISH